jgi:hypothetical protein
MDEFKGRLVTDFGVDRPTIEKASGIIFDFLAKEGPPDKAQTLPSKPPGAQALMQRAADEWRRWRHGRGHGRGHAPDGGRAEHGAGPGHPGLSQFV